jgi:hypothetical protein
MRTRFVQVVKVASAPILALGLVWPASSFAGPPPPPPATKPAPCVNPNAQTLGDGLVANAPLPAGETAIRFKTQPLYGVMLVSSFSF